MLNGPLVDTHVHLWDPTRLCYAWLRDVPAINRPYLPVDYREACGDHDVQRMVFVQCEADPSQCFEEAQWVSHLAGEDTRLKGIVAGAPLELGIAAGDAVARLAELRLVKGIRRLIQSEPHPEFCLQPAFVAGVQMLAEFDFSFDLCITHSQMASTIKLVRQCPNVRFVLDHIGKPDIKRHTMEPWKQELRELARLQNVWCKISGLVTEADVEHWQPADLRPYIQHVIDCFGFDRIMFGGDWPVALLATTLPRWIETLTAEVAGCSDSERQRLFCDNGVAFYRLD